MSAFVMQVACSCDGAGPSGMEQLQCWDGDLNAGFVEGRRYIWKCPECGHTVCVNMKLIEEEDE